MTTPSRLDRNCARKRTSNVQIDVSVPQQPKGSAGGSSCVGLNPGIPTSKPFGSSRQDPGTQPSALSQLHGHHFDDVELVRTRACSERPLHLRQSRTVQVVVRYPSRNGSRRNYRTIRASVIPGAAVPAAVENACAVASCVRVIKSRREPPPPAMVDRRSTWSSATRSERTER